MPIFRLQPIKLLFPFPLGRYENTFPYGSSPGWLSWFDYFHKIDFRVGKSTGGNSR